MRINKTFGEISVPVALALSVGVTILGGVSSYYSSQKSFDEKLAESNKDIAVLQTKGEAIDDTVDEVKYDVKEVKALVNALVINQGLNPAKITATVLNTNK